MTENPIKEYILFIFTEEMKLFHQHVPNGLRNRDLGDLANLALDCAFGWDSPRDPDTYLLIDWDNEKVLSKTAKVSEIGPSQIILLIPNKQRILDVLGIVVSYLKEDIMQSKV